MARSPVQWERKCFLKHLNGCHKNKYITSFLVFQRDTYKQFLNLSPTTADIFSGASGCKVYTNSKSRAVSKICHTLWWEDSQCWPIFPVTGSQSACPRFWNTGWSHTWLCMHPWFLYLHLKKKKKVSSSFTPHTYSNRAGTEDVSGEVGWGAISTESTCLLNSSKFHLNLEIYLQDQILFPSESAKISSVISVLGMQNIANCFCTLLRFAEVPFQVLQKRDLRKNCCTHQQLFLPPRLHPPRCHHWHQMCLYRIVQANEYRIAS